MKRPFSPPRLVISARSLGGATRAPRERILELSARYDDPRSLAVAISKALAGGAEGVVAAPSAGVRAALAELEEVVPFFAAMATTFDHDRLPAEPAITGWPARASLPIGAWARLRRAVTGLTHLAARDSLAARVARSLEAEAPSLPRRGLRAVILSSHVTDLALAAGHHAFFRRTLGFMRSRFGVAAALETCNLGVLLARLEEWGITPDFVLGPFNPLGLQMKPTPAETIDQVRRSKSPILATELRAGGLCPLEEAATWALAHGAQGLAPDLSDVEDAGAELKVLARGVGERG
jgi:hypothetical protein